MSSSRAPEDHYVEVEGGHLYAEVAGSGPKVLLVHSGITDRRMWDDQFAVLAERFRVARYDMRGFGLSTPVVGSYSHVDDLETVIEELEMVEPRLVAASMGGRVAIDLAIRRPALVNRLLLVGSAVGGARFEDAALRACWAEMSAAWDAGDSERMIDIETRFWINGPGRPEGGADEALIERVVEMQRRIVELLPEDENDPEIDEPFAAIDRLAELTMPILVVVGEHDVSDIHRNAEAIRSAVPDARVVTLPDTGHLPNMEAVVVFNRLALEFLG